MKNYTAVFKVTGWDDFEGQEYIWYGAFPADTFTEAAADIEEHFGDELLTMEIELIDQSLVRFDKETYEAIKKGDF